MTQIDDLIAQKRQMLNLARIKVKALEEQVAALTAMNAPDEFDTLLEEQLKKAAIEKFEPTQQTLVKKLNTTGLEGFNPKLKLDVVTAVTAKALTTKTGRNPKGSIGKAIQDLLFNGSECDVDDLFPAINKLLAVPISRGALRATLMNMKNDGLLISRKAGVFRLAQKDEGLNVSSIQAFNSQPSPMTGTH